MNIAFSTNAGSFTATSSNVVVSAATASQLVITQQPLLTATAGAAFGRNRSSRRRTRTETSITTDSTHTVTAARGTTGTSPLQGTLTVTFSSGVGDLQRPDYDKAETMNIAFSTNAGSFTATSSSVVVSAAAASQLVITQQPLSTATAGTAFGTQPIVKEEDAYGKRDYDGQHAHGDGGHRQPKDVDPCGDDHGDALQRRGHLQWAVVRQGRDDEHRFQHQRRQFHRHFVERGGDAGRPANW